MNTTALPEQDALMRPSLSDSIRRVLRRAPSTLLIIKNIFNPIFSPAFSVQKEKLEGAHEKGGG